MYIITTHRPFCNIIIYSYFCTCWIKLIATRLPAEDSAKIQYSRLNGIKSTENRIRHESINFGEIIIKRYVRSYFSIVLHTPDIRNNLSTIGEEVFRPTFFCIWCTREHGACCKKRVHVHATKSNRCRQAENASRSINIDLTRRLDEEPVIILTSVYQNYCNLNKLGVWSARISTW